MSDPARLLSPETVIRFGIFELDLRGEELLKAGLRVRLQRQPFQILNLLIERSGQVVAREEIRARLWPDGTFVDFDHSLNTAVKKLRQALGDDAAAPRYIETIPRRGYRFIASVDGGTSRPYALTEVKPWRTPERIDSIAVLPFENLGGGPDADELCDAITEAIINDLSALEPLRVLPRSTVFRYKGKDLDPAEISRELRVRAVLMGRLFERGEDLIVAAELVDAIKESQLWGKRYTRKLTDASALRDEIAREAFGEVQRAIAAEDVRRNARMVPPAEIGGENSPPA